MFTGIIEEKGIISKIMKTDSQAVLTIKASKIMNDIHKGDSIAVNGKAGKQRESGAGHGSGRQVWRPYRVGAY